jgi:hypothetical protein
MPWGKFEGMPFSEIESGYLVWVIESCDHVKPELLDAITDELRSRFGSSPPSLPRGAPKPCPDADLALDIVSAGLKTLARKHHPDSGGDTATMQRLNRVADWLKASVS